MPRKQREKQKHWRKQNQTSSRGIAHVFLLITAAIVIVIIVVSLLPSQERQSYYSKPVSNPTLYVNTVENNEHVTPAQISTAPLSTIQTIAVLDIPSKVRTGITVPLIIRIKNIGNKYIELERESIEGYPFSHSFRVTDLNGKEIWYWKQPGSNLDVLSIGKIAPNEILTIQGEWKQVGNKGNTVPPGTYIVHGSVHPLNTKLEIKPETLTIVP